MDYIFKYSLFDGDISSWDTSNVTNMKGMFSYAINFNQLVNFDTSNVTSIISMFSYTRSFNQAINFNTSNVIDMDWMFYNAEAFQDKYNSGKELLYHTNEIKEWINNNRDKMNNLDIKDKYGDQINDFFFNITNLTFYQNATSFACKTTNK